MEKEVEAKRATEHSMIVEYEWTTLIFRDEIGDGIRRVLLLTKTGEF